MRTVDSVMQLRRFAALALAVAGICAAPTAIAFADEGGIAHNGAGRAPVVAANKHGHANGGHGNGAARQLRSAGSVVAAAIVQPGPTGSAQRAAPTGRQRAKPEPHALKFDLPGFDQLSFLPSDLTVLARVPGWTWIALGALALLAVALASALAIVVRRLRRAAERAEALAGLASTDPLTGLLNRRGLEGVLAVECARARRYGGQVAVVFGDLRALKTINDRFGHDVGDRALRQVAAVMRSQIREGDSAGRVGGDEYAVTLVNQDEQGAAAFCERVRTRLAGVRSPANGIPLDLTMGIAVFPRDGGTPGDLLAAADRDLYSQRGISVGS